MLTDDSASLYTLAAEPPWCATLCARLPPLLPPPLPPPPPPSTHFNAEAEALSSSSPSRAAVARDSRVAARAARVCESLGWWPRELTESTVLASSSESSSARATWARTVSSPPSHTDRLQQRVCRCKNRSALTTQPHSNASCFAAALAAAAAATASGSLRFFGTTPPTTTTSAWAAFSRSVNGVDHTLIHMCRVPKRTSRKSRSASSTWSTLRRGAAPVTRTGSARLDGFSGSVRSYLSTMPTPAVGACWAWPGGGARLACCDRLEMDVDKEGGAPGAFFLGALALAAVDATRDTKANSDLDAASRERFKRPSSSSPVTRMRHPTKLDGHRTKRWRQSPPHGLVCSVIASLRTRFPHPLTQGRTRPGHWKRSWSAKPTASTVVSGWPGWNNTMSSQP